MNGKGKGSQPKGGVGKEGPGAWTEQPSVPHALGLLTEEMLSRCAQLSMCKHCQAQIGPSYATMGMGRTTQPMPGPMDSRCLQPWGQHCPTGMHTANPGSAQHQMKGHSSRAERKAKRAGGGAADGEDAENTARAFALRVNSSSSFCPSLSHY